MAQAASDHRMPILFTWPILEVDLLRSTVYHAPAGVGSIPANPDAQNVPPFRRWRLEMKLSPFYHAPQAVPVFCAMFAILVLCSVHATHGQFCWSNIATSITDMEIFVLLPEQHTIMCSTFFLWAVLRLTTLAISYKHPADTAH
jgi:hypothetical protein